MKQCMPCGVPMIALYPFQADRLAAIESTLCAGVRRQLVAWATGLGKTVLFAHFIARRRTSLVWHGWQGPDEG